MNPNRARISRSTTFRLGCCENKRGGKDTATTAMVSNPHSMWSKKRKGLGWNFKKGLTGAGDYSNYFLY
jgi:hypothetical protein